MIPSYLFRICETTSQGITKRTVFLLGRSGDYSPVEEVYSCLLPTLKDLCIHFFFGILRGFSLASYYTIDESIGVIYEIQNGDGMTGPEDKNSATHTRVQAFMRLHAGKEQCIQSYISTMME